MHERIIKLRNAYAGREALFIGTGASLCDYNLHNLRDDIVTFGFNRLVPYYKDFWPELKLDFYMCHDPTVFQTSFYQQFCLRKELEYDEGYDLQNQHVLKYKDLSTANSIIENKLYENTKIIFSSNTINPHAKRFSLKQNSEWITDNLDLINQNDNFLPYKIQTNISCYKFPSVVDDCLELTLWAKNSFCNSGLPIMFYLGFSKIYLAGVDYNNKGHFFCKSTNAVNYVDKEYSDLELLVKSVSDSVKIYTIRHKDSSIVTEHGGVEFSTLEK